MIPSIIFTFTHETFFALLLFGGALLTFIGNIGLVRLRYFYARVHAPTLGTTLGGGLILIATALYLKTLTPLLVFAFILLTTPITLIMLARAALYRDRLSGDPNVPPKGSQPPANIDCP